MSETVALDDNGEPMVLFTLNTICPVEHKDEARTIALFHLTRVESLIDNDVNKMLPDSLYTEGNLTHIMCSRPSYINGARLQNATMAAEFLNGKEWVSDTFFYLEDNPDKELIKSKFCFVIGDTAELLNYLGLTKGE